MVENNVPDGNKVLDVEMAQIELKTLEEDSYLKALDAMLSNVLIGVRACRRNSDNGIYNKFNADKFGENLDTIKKAAKNMFADVE